MGHILLGPLPRTREWKKVVALLAHGANAAQLANATIFAAQKAFLGAADDVGVGISVWLLLKLPWAARANDFPAALRDLGLPVSDSLGLMEILGAVADGIDAQLPNNRLRSDLGEMAQMALVETLAEVVGSRGEGLFANTPEGIRADFAAHATVKQLGVLARAYFARFVNKCLGYYLSRALNDQVGEGCRFATTAEQSAFCQALETHCREAAYIVERFSGEWTSSELHREGDVSREGAREFAYGALHKLVAELRQGAGLDGH